MEDLLDMFHKNIQWSIPSVTFIIFPAWSFATSGWAGTIQAGFCTVCCTLWHWWTKKWWRSLYKSTYGNSNITQATTFTKIYFTALQLLIMFQVLRKVSC